MSISQSVWNVGRQRGVLLVDVNDWDSASCYSLRVLGSDGTVARCTRGGATRELLSSELRLLDFPVVPEVVTPGEAHNRQVCAPAQMRSFGHSGQM